MQPTAVIGKLSLEVEYNTSRGEVTPLNDLQNWLQTQFVPRLEEVLERVNPKDTVVLDTVVIDLGTIRLDHIPTDKLEEAIRRQIRKAETLEDENILTASAREAETLIYFLRHGILPWWKSPVPEARDIWEKQLIASFQREAIGETTLRQIFQQSGCLSRLNAAFSPELCGLLKEQYERLNSPPVYQGKVPPENKTSTDVPTDATPFTPVRVPGDSPDAVVKVSTQVSESGAWKDPIYVKNAGLVLLHPFLEMLFGELGIGDGTRIHQPETAMQVLQWLATGRTGVEWDMPLNKLLCGIHPLAPLEPGDEISEEIKRECTRLLEAVVRHWNILGDTSPDGLRGSFLCRDGKLTPRKDGSWLLQVEQKSFDLLLTHLPWNISIIRLPWMPDPLWVEWG